jgi:hypothetical protein
MKLENEISKARQEIVSDGYDMSVGEIISLYQNGELFINPVYQRLFRWDASRKTRFIESLLLGIPIPPIFVYQNPDGVWELIDGLQRISTILQFVGDLKKSSEDVLEKPLVLEGTKFLPSLVNSVWSDSPKSGQVSIGRKQQLQIKRARIRVEILKQESDVHAKYELFQRLNTGGVGLSEQEVRNCVAVMLDNSFYQWMVDLAADQNFLSSTNQTEYAIRQQIQLELVLRFSTFRNIPYQNGLDVHEYLDNAMVKLIEKKGFSKAKETEVFKKTFKYIYEALGASSFKKWDGKRFTGMFLMSVYEVVSIGISKNIDRLDSMPSEKRKQYIQSRAKALWSDDIFIKNSGAGVRGTTRLANLLPIAEAFFKTK